jgi:hypothetical protein
MPDEVRQSQSISPPDKKVSFNATLVLFLPAAPLSLSPPGHGD